MSLLQRVSEGPRTFWRVQGLGDFDSLSDACDAATAAGMCVRWRNVYPAGECTRQKRQCHTGKCLP